MPDRIKGITIEIGGDTTGLSKALKDVNSDLKTAQNSLKDVNSLLKLDPGNVELLRQKQGYLNDAIASTEEKLQKEKEALEQMKNADGFDQNSEQAKALERQIAADEQALSSLKEESRKFGSVASQQFKLVGQKVKDVGDKITDVGKSMSMKVTAPITAVGAASIAAFKEVDEGMDIVVQKTGASGEALEGMQRSVENLATSIPTDFATAGTAIGEVNTRFGLTGQALEDLSGQFIKFAELNETDVTTAVDSTQKALAAFGLGAEDAGSLLDTLNAVGQQTGTSMDTLLSGLVSNSAAFNEMGLSIDQAAIFMGQMEMSGSDASAVMGGLQKALKNATEDGIPLNDALAQLQDTILNGTGATDGLTAAYDLFGKSGAQVYEAVKNGAIDFTTLSNAVIDASGSVNDTFAATVDPIDNVTTALNQAKIAGADLGEAIQTAAAPIIQKFADLMKTLTEKFRELTPEQQQTIVKIGAIVAAIGPALIVIGKIVSGVGSVISILGTVIGVLGGPLTVAIGAAVAAGVLIYKNWDTIKEKATQLKEWVSEKWTELKEKVTETAENIKAKVTEKWETMKTNVSTKVTNMADKAKTKFNEIKASASEKFEAMKTAVTSKFESIRSAIVDKITAAKNTVGEMIEKIKGFFNFEWKLPHLALPHFSVSGSINPFDWFEQGVPHINVEWYKKAYGDPIMFTQPTVLPTPGGLKGFGDGSGAEVVLGLNKLKQLVGGGETNIQINVYGAEGQSVNQLAEEIERRLVDLQQQRSAVWA